MKEGGRRKGGKGREGGREGEREGGEGNHPYEPHFVRIPRMEETVC